MTPSPIEEIKRIRRQLAAECGNDVRRIGEETRRHERESGRTYIDAPINQSELFATPKKALDQPVAAMAGS